VAEQRLIVNRYQIIEQIGQGGMGTVYRGIDTLSGQEVAVKLLKPEIVASNPDLLKRFEREGEALRRLNHPNIVKMYGTAEENGYHYIIMEYVPGGTLRDILHRYERLQVSRVMEGALDLADALTRAHRLKIIHRDIKPANILLAEDESPRLTDFGVAHVDDKTRVTETGAVIGTYAYLSPEVCGGQPADERSDIWSFGVLLYEMLAGKNPFEGSYPAATITNILHRPTPDLLAERPDAPPALARLIDRMLEKDPSKRISSVRQVGLELESIIRGVDTPALENSSDLVRIINNPHESRFDTPTPSNTPRNTPSVPAEPNQPTVTPIMFTPDARTEMQTIKGHDGTDYVVMPHRTAKKVYRALIIAVVALVILIGGGIVYGLMTDFGDDVQDVPEADDMEIVEPPIAENEYMVLVGRLEPINTAEREVTRFVVDNLQQHLEIESPLSDIRVREYPGVLRSALEAKAAAEANGAPVVIWGNYGADFTELNIQVGVLNNFPYTQIPLDMIERTANVRVRLTDERNQSATPQVLGMLDVLQTADGNGYEALRIAALLENLRLTSGEIMGDSTAARFHRFFQDLRGAEALNYLEAAITSDSGNPILYSYRSVYYQREGRLEEARLDAISAQRTGPQGWSVPFYLLGSNAVSDNNLPQAIEYYDQVLVQRPDDWFPYYVRGMGYYAEADYDAAKREFDRALELEPNANLPYSLAMMIALREGRLEDADTLLDVVLRRFPDPTFATRVLRIIFGDVDTVNRLIGTQSAFGYLALGQHSKVIEEATTALNQESDLLYTELYLMRGLAECNLQDYATAETDYSSAIETEPDFAILYLLRAEIRAQQGKRLQALADLRSVTQIGGETLGPSLLEHVNDGETMTMSCEDVFGLR
jgi:serine/threonine protein kinase/tetratricopeptide (TPR) repeat protein